VVSERRKRAAVFMENYGLGRCSVALCVLDMMSRDYQIDLYVANVWLGESPILARRSVRIIDLTARSVRWWAGACLRLIRDPRIFPTLVNSLRAWSASFGTPYAVHLTFDPHGFVRCLSLFPEAKPIYASLELYFTDNYFNLSYPEHVMRKERESINQIRGLVIQSREREELFRNEYKLDPSIPSFLLPVTDSGPPERRKSDALFKRLGIPDGSKLLLHLGTIIEYHCCLEMIEAFKNVRGWTLVFHGFSWGDYRERVKDKIRQLNLENVIITDDFFGDFQSIEAIVASCRVGIAWYANMSPNFATAGQSSGKTTSYLRFGLPVVTNNYRASREAIEATGCGVCMESLADLPAALETIESQYERFSENALREYERTYRFENYQKGLASFLVAPT
jgi:glycosyltransferase involved in cell wall biosynthesis